MITNAGKDIMFMKLKYFHKVKTCDNRIKNLSCKIADCVNLVKFCQQKGHLLDIASLRQNSNITASTLRDVALLANHSVISASRKILCECCYRLV